MGIDIINQKSCKNRANEKGFQKYYPLKPLPINALPSGLEPETL